MRKTITIGETTLSYVERNLFATKTIFFIHGNSGSSKVWQRQFESRLLENYRLVAIDLPGHGLSSHSKNPSEDYSPIGTATILSKAISELANKNEFVIAGFSYGSNLAAEVLALGLKPSGLVFVASCVLGENYGLDKIFIRSSQPSILLYNELDAKTVETYMSKSLLSTSEEDLHNCIEDYLRVDVNFKTAVFKAAYEGKISDEIKTLQKKRIPACVIFGKNDTLIHVDYLDSTPFPIWRNHIYKLLGAGHWAHIDSADSFNQLIRDYSDECLK